MGKIKVLHIIGCLRLGGAETLLYNFISASGKEKFEHEVVTIQPVGYYWEEKSFQKLGVKIYPIDFGEKHEQNYFGTFRILSLILKSKPDIIHFHNKSAHLWFFPIFKVAHFLLGRKICCINTIHATFQYKNPLKRRILEKFAAPFIDKQVAISEGVKNYHCKRFKTNSSNFEIIPNGVPLEKFTKSPFNDVVKNIITVANLFPKTKGYEVSIESIKKLVKIFPNIKYHIVGEGPLREMIEAFIRDNNLQNNIKLLGSCDNVPVILSKMDVFLLPSLWEGFGLVNIEAMASGLPVIATNVGGVPEILGYGEFGILIEPNNSEVITSAIELLINDVNRREGLCKKSLERAEKYKLSVMVDKYEKLYDELLK